MRIDLGSDFLWSDAGKARRWIVFVSQSFVL